MSVLRTCDVVFITATRWIEFCIRRRRAAQRFFFAALPPPGFFSGTALPRFASASLMAVSSSVMAASPVAKRLRLTSQASSAACWLDVATPQSGKPVVGRKTLMRGGRLGLGIAVRLVLPRLVLPSDRDNTSGHRKETNGEAPSRVRKTSNLLALSPRTAPAHRRPFIRSLRPGLQSPLA